MHTKFKGGRITLICSPSHKYKRGTYYSSKYIDDCIATNQLQVTSHCSR